MFFVVIISRPHFQPGAPIRIRLPCPNVKEFLNGLGRGKWQSIRNAFPHVKSPLRIYKTEDFLPRFFHTKGFDMKNRPKPRIRPVVYYLECCIEARFLKIASRKCYSDCAGKKDKFLWR
jgi:hypothetical protein